MTTLEARNAALDRAKALVLAGWCQGVFARDASGMPTRVERKEAVSFCIVGATFRATGVKVLTDAPCGDALKRALVGLGFGESLARYNDEEGRTKYEVAAIFDHAKEMPL